MGMNKIPLAVVMAVAFVGVLLTVTTAGLISVNQTVPSSGTLSTVDVGVYSDSACTQTLTSIDWGTISPGNTVTRTIYVKNTGNAQITLSMTKSNWNPASADGPITLTWNRESTTLTAGQSTMATLTLTVSSGISSITTFSVNIIVTGTG